MQTPVKFSFKGHGALVHGNTDTDAGENIE